MIKPELETWKKTPTNSHRSLGKWSSEIHKNHYSFLCHSAIVDKCKHNSIKQMWNHAGLQGIIKLNVYYSAVSVADIKVIHIWD